MVKKFGKKALQPIIVAMFVLSAFSPVIGTHLDNYKEDNVKNKIENVEYSDRVLSDFFSRIFDGFFSAVVGNPIFRLMERVFVGVLSLYRDGGKVESSDEVVQCPTVPITMASSWMRSFALSVGLSW